MPGTDRLNRALRAFPRGVRRLAPAVTVGLLGVLLSVALWQSVLTERRARLRATAAAVAADSRHVIAAAVESRHRALRNLAAFWARFGRQPLDEWQFDAHMIIEHLPGLRRIAWIDPAFDSVRLAANTAETEALHVPSEAEQRELLPILEGARRRGADESEIAGPFRDEHGQVLYRAYLQVGSGASKLGVLAATIAVEEMLTPVLRDTAQAYAVRIFWGDEEVYRRGEPAREFAWWVQEGEVQLSAGPRWRVLHAPTAELAAAALTDFPTYLLAGGILVSALLAALIHEIGVARAHARSLDRSFRELDAQISETLAAEAALRELNRDLERRVAVRTAELDEAVRDLESFNYSVSHDLRSPLGAILNFSVLLEEDFGAELGAGGRQLLERIRRCAESGVGMMDGLLALSRLGREQLKTERVDMAHLTREVFEEVLAEDPRPRVRFELGPLPDVDADRRMMRVLLANLLRNALKFTRGRDPATIQVSGHTTEEEHVYCVRDDGVGFDMRFARKLFGVFERLHPADQFEGTGVGLAIVERVVRRHHGRVWAEGEVSRGAAFSFALPRQRGTRA